MRLSPPGPGYCPLPEPGGERLAGQHLVPVGAVLLAAGPARRARRQACTGAVGREQVGP